MIPDGIIESLDDQQLACVIAHEAAHVSRRDTAFSLFQQLATATCWWNPFVRATNHRIDLLREQICDDFVVTKFGEGRALASALVTVIEWSCARSAPLPLIAQLLSDFDAMETRIRRLLDRDRDRSNRLNFSTAAQIGGFVFFLMIVPMIPLVKTQICVRLPMMSSRKSRSAGICRFASSIRTDNPSPILASEQDWLLNSRLPNGTSAMNRVSVRFDYPIVPLNTVTCLRKPAGTLQCGHSGGTAKIRSRTCYQQNSRSK